MLSRLLSVLVSLLLLAIVGGFSAMLVLKYGIIKNSYVIWEILLIFLPVNLVIVWLSWQAIRRLSRYRANPFQIRSSYQIRLLENVDAALGPIVIEGSALLIVSSNISGTQIHLRDVQPAERKFYRRFPHGQREVEFLLKSTETWSATLAAKAPKVLATTIPFLSPARADGIFATLVLEIRGHCRILQLPEYVEEGHRGFPVVLKDVP